MAMARELFGYGSEFKQRGVVEFCFAVVIGESKTLLVNYGAFFETRILPLKWAVSAIDFITESIDKASGLDWIACRLSQELQKVQSGYLAR